MSEITLRAPAAVAVPRGAPWAASAFAAVLQFVRKSYDAWHAHNEQMRRFDEAAALRRVAAGIAHTDPSFASDLFAAADRHIGGR
ncbi:MAG: hypothetical protein JNL85_18860 [Rubrivivax sp.]|nr:hypothetical protein [Rubrivivax sp.]